jgi:uncharacterized protein YbbK (DUF523 family)
MILISACLLGHRTKYDGGSNDIPLLIKHASLAQFIAFCPETMGGLPVPRPAAEIISGSGEDVLAGRSRVVNKLGDDVTELFVRGAQKSARLIAGHSVTAAIIKQRSPSCGSRQIYDGSFRHVVKPGTGVTAAMLYQLGIPIYSEEDITPELLERLIQSDLK